MRIVIAEYTTEWPAAYEQERDKLVGALGQRLIGIHHIGSTSVPGLGAKPIIDIGVAIDRYPLPERVIRAVEALGYEHMGEYGIPGRHYFRKGNPRTHHVHAYEVTSDELDRQLLFRDYLRANPQTAHEYERLKRALATRLGHDRDLYTEAKSDFVLGVLAKARAWRESEEKSVP